MHPLVAQVAEVLGQPRLRQVAFVAAELDPVVEQLRGDLGLGEPYHDPQVALFGLRNAVFAVGDCFLEVVSPVEDDTTAGRYLQRRGGDAGYMAIFQVPDVAAARERVGGLGIRVAWQIDLDDMSTTHLHPRDVPGALVSLDWSDPPQAWRWAGPAWTGGAPDHDPGGIASLEVRAVDPFGLAARWAAVLGVEADGAQIGLGDQRLTFTSATDRAAEGICAVGLRAPRAETVVCGVRVHAEPA